MLARSNCVFLAALSLCAFVCGDGWAPEQAPWKFEVGSLPPHPRLVATDEIVARVRASLSFASANRTYALLLAEGISILPEPPVLPPPISPSSGILATARKIVGRLYTLGLLYRITGEAQWVARAEEEMLAVAKFPTWNPGHFLDVGEITGAMAFGYDWMYSGLTSDGRSAVATAIYELGLKEGLRAAYNGTTANGWWWKSYINWNQVCNSGMALGALAIGDDPRYASAAQFVLTKALEGIPYSLKEFAPAGVWPEGVAYFGYSLKYTTALLASLETVFGSDEGLALTGLKTAGDFLINSLSPANTYFNWADAGDKQQYVYASLLMWLGRRFDVPAHTYAARAIADHPGSKTDEWGSTAWHLLFFSSSGSYSDLSALPLLTYDATRNVGFFRTAWTTFAPAPSPTCAWVGFKGGNNSINHNHLDHGSFVFYLNGGEWVIDLGPDNYSLPGYFGHERFTYYRLNNRGHNTLTFDDEIQSTSASDSIAAFRPQNNTPFAIIELNAAYKSSASAVRRGISLVVSPDCTQTGLIVADRIVGPRAKNVLWAIHTRAKAAVTADGKSVTLSSGGASVQLVFSKSTASTCPHARFNANAVNLPAPQYSTAGVTRVTATSPTADCSELAVLFGATDFTARVAPLVAPLDSWTKTGPIHG